MIQKLKPSIIPHSDCVRMRWRWILVLFFGLGSLFLVAVSQSVLTIGAQNSNAWVDKSHALFYRLDNESNILFQTISPKLNRGVVFFQGGLDSASSTNPSTFTKQLCLYHFGWFVLLCHHNFVNTLDISVAVRGAFVCVVCIVCS